MIISHPYQCIFLATPKCASRAVAQVLRQQYEAQVVNAGKTASAHHDNTVPRHFLNDYLLVSVKRNPYSRLVSMYRYIQRTTEHRYYLDVATQEFGEFADYWQAQTQETDIPDEMTQTDFIWGDGWHRKGRVVLLRFEQLEDDFKRIPLPSVHAMRIPKTNYHGRYDWRDYYTPAIQEQVYGYFQTDFEALGYAKEIV